MVRSSTRTILFYTKQSVDSQITLIQSDLGILKNKENMEQNNCFNVNSPIIIIRHKQKKTKATMGMQREDRKTARMYRDGAKGMHAGLISLHNLCGAPPFTVRT